MIKNSVIIIPNVSNEEQVCDFLFQTAKELRKNNNVYVLNYYDLPRLLPFRRFSKINQLNRNLYLILFQIYLYLKHFRAKNFYFWVFFPEISTIGSIRLPNWKLIFDIVDYHFSPIESRRKELEKQKDELFNRADYVFCISKTLKKLYQKRSPKEIKIVPQGFAIEDFNSAASSDIKLPAGKPIIGFIGQISQRLDLKLLHELIGNKLEWNFVFIGPVHHESNVSDKLDEKEVMRIMDFKNVFYYGAQNRETLPNIVKQFDVCIIPYDTDHEFNRYCYPMKLFEYFYLGMPIVSTPIEELKKFPNFVMIGKDAKSWKIHIKNLLSEKWSENKKVKQRELALNNSWKNKLEKISSYL